MKMMRCVLWMQCLRCRWWRKKNVKQQLNKIMIVGEFLKNSKFWWMKKFPAKIWHLMIFKRNWKGLSYRMSLYLNLKPSYKERHHPLRWHLLLNHLRCLWHQAWLLNQSLPHYLQHQLKRLCLLKIKRNSWINYSISKHQKDYGLLLTFQLSRISRHSSV